MGHYVLSSICFLGAHGDDVTYTCAVRESIQLIPVQPAKQLQWCLLVFSTKDYKKNTSTGGREQACYFVRLLCLHRCLELSTNGRNTPITEKRKMISSRS